MTSAIKSICWGISYAAAALVMIEFLGLLNFTHFEGFLTFSCLWLLIDRYG